MNTSKDLNMRQTNKALDAMVSDVESAWLVLSRKKSSAGVQGEQKRGMVGVHGEQKRCGTAGFYDELYRH